MNTVSQVAIIIGLVVLADEVFASSTIRALMPGDNDADTAAGAAQGATSGVASGLTLAAIRAANPDMYGFHEFPTRTQQEYVAQKFARRGRTAGPFQWVRRVRTIPNGLRSPRDLSPIVNAGRSILGTEAAGKALATLSSFETGAGLRDWTRVAGYNWNLGNIKAWTNQTGPVFFMRDSHNARDPYPSFDSLEAGMRHKVGLLSNSRYNRPGMKGARQSLIDGDLRALTAALGAGGYAQSYSRFPNLLSSRFQALVRAGALLPGGVIV
jgi:hypothetical protein